MSGTINKPFLSICIPTYNRGEHVSLLVKSILENENEEIEIVVLDNCSTDNTTQLLEQIKDARFMFKQNKENIGGKLNSAQILTQASGEYAFLCLDRDSINVKYINVLIDKLKKNKEVVFGYCLLETKNFISDKLFNKGYQSLLNMTYLSKHPSGNFYKTSILKDLKIFSHIPERYSDFDFIHEFINSESSFKGKSIKINVPIIKTGYTSNKNDFAKHKSYSYNKNNFYFSPLKRIEHFNEYAQEIMILNITSKQKKKMIGKVFFSGLIYSTFSYMNALKDSDICNHYNIKTKKLNFIDLLKIDYFFSKSFFKRITTISFFKKIMIIIINNLKLYMFFIKNKLKS